MAPGYYIIGASVTPPTADPTFAITFEGSPGFAGTPGQANCHGESVSVLAQHLGGMASAAPALGYAGVQALQVAIQTYRGG